MIHKIVMAQNDNERWQALAEVLDDIRKSSSSTADRLAAVEIHLKTLNGRVGKAETTIQAHEGIIAEARGAARAGKWLWALITGIIGAAGAVIGANAK